MSDTDILTIKAFADEIGFSERQVRRWIEKEQITYRKNPGGGRPYFRKEDVATFKEAEKVKAHV